MEVMLEEELGVDLVQLETVPDPLQLVLWGAGLEVDGLASEGVVGDEGVGSEGVVGAARHPISQQSAAYHAVLY